MSVMSLAEEFSQYINELQALHIRITQALMTHNGFGFDTALIELNITTNDINAVILQNASSPEIYAIANRADKLIKLLEAKCVSCGI